MLVTWGWGGVGGGWGGWWGGRGGGGGGGGVGGGGGGGGRSYLGRLACCMRYSDCFWESVVAGGPLPPVGC